MKYDVNYAKEHILRDEVVDRWFWTTVEADSEEQAIEKVIEDKSPSYIISVGLLINHR